MLRQTDATGEAQNSAGGNRLILSDARVVTPDHVLHGSVVIEDGRIAEIHEGPSRHREAVDFRGDYLLPGLVDIHTDHFEKHLYPRAHVRWDFIRAALAHDAQIIGGGVTTVFDSLCVGATTDNPERAEILKPMIEALEQAQGAGMFRAEHLVHLRCELTDPVAPQLTAEHIDRQIVRVLSVMEHLPGIRQSRDIEAYVVRACKSTGESPDRVREKIKVLVAEKSHIAAMTRPDIVALARARSIPLMSHDDTDVAHIEAGVAEGVSISEFPCSIEAAEAARHAGMKIVAGAPNLVRGGSQSGNIAVRDLLATRLVDILASDYVPRSMLDAAFMISADPGLDYDLPSAVALVTRSPALAGNLPDRGAIQTGLKADIIRVDLQDGHPFLKSAWRSGHRVA
ncbi:alpha-D-ribose 1-methylphosphonate 5-triphosphate diphosphatase [Rhizobium glycinendophyticum]|uniref:Alpha-D-ribose 1-methylphosphonate 5-triphosphate diphosphatase n=1 Tax=Rhizobium glycinendophyticum TaxID=2589807 RepID=A0A504TVT7_9HYPH|nr:alpha-D-ribose 1-methylphosphonate 5-triphosphate diphosphatase [Rhizobium glycinendophyticum]TPP06594.1 alpha-D-ribose 1-methylphosphonate 5-triphosphate diphosphatase [Rhizobium glycinendophyticum]